MAFSVAELSLALVGWNVLQVPPAVPFLIRSFWFDLKDFCTWLVLLVTDWNHGPYGNIGFVLLESPYVWGKIHNRKFTINFYPTDFFKINIFKRFFQEYQQS